jgi:hypothetical protein
MVMLLGSFWAEADTPMLTPQHAPLHMSSWQMPTVFYPKKVLKA